MRLEEIKNNLVKLNNGETARFSYSDNFGRKIFSFEDGSKNCLLDDEIFFSLSKNFGEPDCPLQEEYQPSDIRIFDDAIDDQTSLETWNDYFEPISYDDEDDKTFDCYEDAVKYVEKHIISKPYDDWDGVDEKLYNKPHQHIWSIIDGESGKLILLNGYHKVNVLGYLVCKIPWGNGTDSDANVYLEVKYEE